MGRDLSTTSPAIPSVPFHPHLASSGLPFEPSPFNFQPPALQRFNVPTFQPSEAALSPLPATLIDLPASVANKRLTVWVNPLDATLTKNRGAHPSSQKFFSLLHSPDVRRLRPSDVSTGKRLDVSLACLPSSVRSSKFRIPQSLCLPLLRKLPGHILQAKGFSLSSPGSFSSLFTLCTKSVSELLSLQRDPHSF